MSKSILSETITSLEDDGEEARVPVSVVRSERPAKKKKPQEPDVSLRRYLLSQRGIEHHYNLFAFGREEKAAKRVRGKPSAYGRRLRAFKGRKTR